MLKNIASNFENHVKISGQRNSPLKNWRICIIVIINICQIYISYRLVATQSMAIFVSLS